MFVTLFSNNSTCNALTIINILVDIYIRCATEIMQIENLPFDLPFELCEIIFGYLNSKDILKCCLVSKAWLDFYNKTTLCKRITLTIDDSVELSDLRNISRRFVKIKLNKLKNSSLFDILNHFAQPIEEMEIENCETIDEYDINFHNLKCLSITSCSADVITKLFKFQCINLKCLVLYRLYGPATHHVLKFLKINDTLEEVNFYLDEINNIFLKDISHEVKFKLKSIFISYKSSCDLPTKALTNIEKFLKTQGDTLETISLINSANIMLLFRIWNNLKVIERLYLFSSDPSFDHVEHSPPDLCRKSTLADFELHALGPCSLKLDNFITLLNAAVELKFLGVWYLKKELVEYIARNCHTLRFISCATMESDCLTFYNELKSKIGINDKMQIHQYL